MTQAKRVHSTPPTNTSALPVDPTRRRLLTIATGGAVAAAIPAAALADASAVDPIYAAIGKHQQAVAAHDAVVDVRAAFDDFNMNDEQKTQLAGLKAAVEEAWDRLEDTGSDLVNTKSTTLAGVAALCRYVEPLLNEQDTVNLPEVICWDDDTASTAAGALANAIAAAVEAIIRQGMQS
ncbi:hypothetical protein [Bradyrhizobium sp. AZCC 1610]|uniref:hypothetical protein n=1 Tax=Bradyrhizobium sp. AZCC 1610 TaxID=3117020 RepID=UPI002FF279FE